MVEKAPATNISKILLYLYGCFLIHLSFLSSIGHRSVQLRQNRTYRDHDLTSCAFRCAATAEVSESRRALRANDVFLLKAQ